MNKQVPFYVVLPPLGAMILFLIGWLCCHHALKASIRDVHVAVSVRTKEEAEFKDKIQTLEKEKVAYWQMGYEKAYSQAVIDCFYRVSQITVQTAEDGKIIVWRKDTEYKEVFPSPSPSPAVYNTANKRK